ncbi:hypothetical protein BDW72DRAFT_185706 [Aspergillus terricola var. indicus]
MRCHSQQSYCCRQLYTKQDLYLADDASPQPLPIKYGVIGRGSDTGAAGLRDQCIAGVAGLKLHQEWGCTPSAIDNCLR